MRCPFCTHEESKVLDSRPVEDGASIRRRRECMRCARRFTTYERMDHVPIMVVKRDGRREPFDRNKILRGLVQAVKAYEQLAIEAARSGDRLVALRALLANPLVARWSIASPLLDALLEANRGHLPRFFAPV